MNFLTGYRTYILSALTVLWALTYVWGWLELTPELFVTILSILGGGTVWAGRKAVK